MAFLTRYGTQFGLRSVRHGRTIFVAPSAQYSGLVGSVYGTASAGNFAASDNNDGLSPERAVRTANYAINTLAQTGDTVILLPGTHTATATLAPRAGVSIFGANGSDGRGSMQTTEVSLTISASAHLWNIVNSNVEIGYLRMYPALGFSTMSFQTPVSATMATNLSENVRGLYVHDCFVDLTATGASGVLTAGIDFRKRSTAAGENYSTSVATVFGLIENCYFAAGAAQGPGIALATCSVHVKNCRFNIASNGIAWASPFMVATNTQASLAENCIWTANGTATYGAAIDGSTLGATPLYAISIVNCRLPASGQLTGAATGIDNFGTALTASLTETYQAGSGTVVTAIT